MLDLIPAWTRNYEQFWASLSGRNLWFIKLRYGAVLMLTALTIGLKFILKIELTSGQLNVFIITTLSILIYNLICHAIKDRIRNEENKFNPLHFALVQMVLDLIALSFVIYYTGGIESPFYIFFIFHMIIGSLILPGSVVYTLDGLIIVSFTVMALLQYFNIIPHYQIAGLFETPIYNNLNYIIVATSSFGIMMVVSVYFANRIAHSLYRREQDLKLTLDQLNEAEVSKQKYIMGVVHEIKTPLAAVQTFLDLVLQKFTGPISEEVEDKLKKARTRSEEAIETINDVLRISKLKLLNNLSKSSVSLDKMIEKLISQQRINADSKAIGIQFCDKRERKEPIQADPVLLELALSNLIGNAVKYSFYTGKIEITTEYKESGTKILIEVADNGIGIPKSELQNIFKEFYRASNIKQIDYEGTGLGLSVVKQIVEQHGGSICAESPSHLADENGIGASFKILMPVE